MTEAEWLSSESPDALLRWLQKSKRHRPTARKLGLFGCACARRLGERDGQELMAAGIALAERMADGTATQEEYRSHLHDSLGGRPWEPLVHIGMWAVRIVAPPLSGISPEGPARSLAGYVAQLMGPDEPAVQARLLREAIGNPYRPVVLPPAWRAPDIVGLAEAAYQDRRLPGGPLGRVRLGVLADALEEAGADAALIDHLRGPDDHVRGCFVLDCILAKK